MQISLERSESLQIKIQSNYLEWNNKRGACQGWEEAGRKRQEIKEETKYRERSANIFLGQNLMS